MSTDNADGKFTEEKNVLHFCIMPVSCIAGVVVLVLVSIFAWLPAWIVALVGGLSYFLSWCYLVGRPAREFALIHGKRVFLQKGGRLSLQSKQIASISEIECTPEFAATVKILDLSGNEIVDFTSLDRFSNLEFLSMADCALHDLPSLDKFEHLNGLLLTGNPGLRGLPLGYLSGEYLSVLKEAGFKGLVARYRTPSKPSDPRREGSSSANGKNVFQQSSQSARNDPAFPRVAAIRKAKTGIESTTDRQPITETRVVDYFLAKSNDGAGEVDFKQIKADLDAAPQDRSTALHRILQALVKRGTIARRGTRYSFVDDR
jgi:hypothetical protein